MSTIAMKDPVDVLAERLTDKPGDVERASRILADVQAQVHRVLFVAPNVRTVEIYWPPPDSYHAACMRISFKVKGGPLFNKHVLEFRLDGRRPETIRLNGNNMPTDIAATHAARYIAKAITTSH